MGVYLGAHHFIALFYLLVFLLPHELEHYVVYLYVICPYFICY